MHASPISRQSFMTVSLETSAMRAVARMPHPSTRADTIWTRFAVLSTFAILDIMLACAWKVNACSKLRFTKISRRIAA